MKWRPVSSGSYEKIAYETKECRGQFLHYINILGPIGVTERIPVFEATLAVNKSENYFCLVDNRAGHENILTVEDMSFLGDLLLDAGIKRFYAAVVTLDEGYRGIVKLMNAVAIAKKKIESETFSSPFYEEAENFLISRTKRFMNPG
ncbi:MAG: hypothetical protein EP348_03700 [Alphaproteobacteria bacterium]|nr:MAG: hypothetical protein EP348_03700 [Alphaproteobacteria bacterium]